MTNPQLILAFAITGFVLFMAELVLPTHGVLGILGAISLAVGIGMCFVVNQWLGLSVLGGAVIALPFTWVAFVKLWPKTPTGRRLILAPAPMRTTPLGSPVHIGQRGKTVSELRPMGMCDFDGERIEVRSELALVKPGQIVEVVAILDGRAIVRAVE